MKERMAGYDRRPDHSWPQANAWNKEVISHVLLSTYMRMCTHTHTRNSYSHAHILQPLAFHMECGARVSWHLRCWTFELRHGYVYSCYSCHVLMFTHAPACKLKTSRRSIKSQKWKKWLRIYGFVLGVSTVGLDGEVKWSHTADRDLLQCLYLCLH